MLVRLSAKLPVRELFRRSESVLVTAGKEENPESVDSIIGAAFSVLPRRAPNFLGDITINVEYEVEDQL